jgi:hypothetical protein
MTQIRFGYWPRKIQLRIGRAEINPLLEFDANVALMEQNNRVANGWLYPPLITENERGGKPRQQTLIYAPRYGIEPTHSLSLPNSSKSQARGEFLIALLGMLEGLRLVPEGWGHFYRAAVKLNALSDVHCSPQDLETVLTTGQDFWNNATDNVRRLMFGAIHWRLFAESYGHEFERFAGQYTVLDTCWRICDALRPKWWQNWTGSQRLPAHAMRARLLAKEYGIPIPSWAKTRKSSGKTRTAVYSKLSKLRNGLIHEGLYGQKPIGFGYPKNFKGSTDLGLRAFNTRLILGILGTKCVYVNTSCETRCSFALDLNG